MDCKTCTHKDLQSFSETCVECGIDMKNYKPITNADRIRSMSDEELAYNVACPGRNHGVECKIETDCNECILDWLKQEVK